MGVKSGKTSFITARIPSGQKTVGSYEYFLLLDMSKEPEHLVMRIKNDDSEIKFYKIIYGKDYTIIWADPSNVAYPYVDATEL